MQDFSKLHVWASLQYPTVTELHWSELFQPPQSNEFPASFPRSEIFCTPRVLRHRTRTVAVPAAE